MNLKTIIAGVLGVIFTTLPTLAAGITNPVIHAVVIGAGAVVGVFVHHTASSSRLWNGNPFSTLTVGAVVAGLLALFAAHLDPSQLTPLGTAVLGAVGAVVGALTHHAVKFPGVSES